MSEDNDREALRRRAEIAEEACKGAEAAIRACPALKEWGPSTLEHLASRVTFLCNLYDGNVHTIFLLDKALTEARAEIARLKGDQSA